MRRTVVIDPVEPAPLSIRMALGADLALDITFLSQLGALVDPDTLIPQLALLPRSQGGVFAYDVGTLNRAGGEASVTVPGAGLTDPAGYTLELYQRAPAATPGDPPVPVGLLATGVLRTQGGAYQRLGPFSAINVPVVVGPPGATGATGPAGPPGQGLPGQRGSIWTTGTGNPTATDALPGDMYLDNATGNVWRWDGLTWVQGTF